MFEFINRNMYQDFKRFVVNIILECSHQTGVDWRYESLFLDVLIEFGAVKFFFLKINYRIIEILIVILGK